MDTAVEPERTTVQWAERIFLGALAGLLLILLVSGLWLVFRYQPSGSFRGARPEAILRRVHRITSAVFSITALATFGLSIAVSVERRLRRGVPAWVGGFVLFLGAVTTAITGYLLAWDQLALWAVTVGTEMRGYGFLFGGHSEVKFLILGGVEVSTSTMRMWFLVHTIALPLAVVVLGLVLARVKRRSRLLAAPAA